MTLESVINHCEKIAEVNAGQYKNCPVIYDTYDTNSNRNQTAGECAEEYQHIVEWLKDYKRLKEQESCEDCVSRKAVLDLVVTNHTELNGINVVMYSPLCKDIKQLSPVPLKPKSDVLDKIRTELIQSIQNGTIKIESGSDMLFRIIDLYKVESEE